MAFLLNSLTNAYKFFFEELADPRVKDYFLISSPLIVMGLIGFYCYFVLKLGPQLMQHRNPFKLDKIIIVYNALQIFVCLYLVMQSFRYTIFSYNILCEPVDYSNGEVPVIIAKHVWLYFMLKIFDLIDSVFFVLRKKNEHLSFLHVYHHAGMVAVGWLGAKYLPGGHSVFFGFVNCIVHAVMYFYYLLSVWNEKYKKNIWWKKHLTQLQMAQLIVLGVYFLQILIQPNCKYPKLIVYFLVPQNLFMLFLFAQFYIKSYINQPQEIEKNSYLRRCRNEQLSLKNCERKT